MMDKKIRAARQGGFTLVEIMVVVVILGLLAGMGAVGYQSFLRKGSIGTAKAQCKQWEDAVNTHLMNNLGEDIPTDEIWDQLIESRVVKDKKIPKDPWGKPYQVEIDDDGNAVVWSMGKNKQPEDDDDVFRNGLRSEIDEDDF